MPPIKPRNSWISLRLHLPQYQSRITLQRCLFKQSYTLQWINECAIHQLSSWAACCKSTVGINSTLSNHCGSNINLHIFQIKKTTEQILEDSIMTVITCFRMQSNVRMQIFVDSMIPSSRSNHQQSNYDSCGTMIALYKTKLKIRLLLHNCTRDRGLHSIQHFLHTQNMEENEIRPITINIE